MGSWTVANINKQDIHSPSPMGFVFLYGHYLKINTNIYALNSIKPSYLFFQQPLVSEKKSHPLTIINLLCFCFP